MLTADYPVYEEKCLFLGGHSLISAYSHALKLLEPNIKILGLCKEILMLHIFSLTSLEMVSCLIRNLKKRPFYLVSQTFFNTSKFDYLQLCSPLRHMVVYYLIWKLLLIAMRAQVIKSVALLLGSWQSYFLVKILLFIVLIIVLATSEEKFVYVWFEIFPSY